MVRFIKQEAEEKANEIGISAEEVLLILLRCDLFGCSIIDALSASLTQHSTVESTIFIFRSST